MNGDGSIEELTNWVWAPQNPPATPPHQIVASPPMPQPVAGSSPVEASPGHEVDEGDVAAQAAAQMAAQDALDAQLGLNVMTTPTITPPSGGRGGRGRFGGRRGRGRGRALFQ